VLQDALLDVSVVDGPLPIVVYALAGACFVYLLFRERSVAWALGVIVLLIVGAIVGAGLLLMLPMRDADREAEERAAT
jgi:hypothetical protein